MAKPAAPPSLVQVGNFIKEAAKSGKVRFTSHALQEMQADRLTLLDIDFVIGGCRVLRLTDRDMRRGTWTYECVGATDDGARVTVQVAVREPLEGSVTVITVWEIKTAKKRRNKSDKTEVVLGFAVATSILEVTDHEQV